jgi:hypothetical protein
MTDLRPVVRCGICGRGLDPHDRTHYRRVQGWEHKAAHRKGASDITLREPLDQWAHAGCVTLKKDGINPGQEDLLA